MIIRHTTQLSQPGRRSQREREKERERKRKERDRDGKRHLKSQNISSQLNFFVQNVKTQIVEAQTTHDTDYSVRGPMCVLEFLYNATNDLSRVRIGKKRPLLPSCNF